MSEREADAVRALLESKGYRYDDALPRGTWNAWWDVDPRHGTRSASLLVVEDPSRPIVDELAAAYGGSVKSG